MFTYVKPFLYIEALLILSLWIFRFALRPANRDIVSVKLVAIVLFTPFMALFCRNIYIFYAYLVLVTAFSARTRLELCSLYMVLITLCPALYSYLMAGGAMLLYFTSMAAIGLGALVALLFLPGKKGRPLLLHDGLVVVIIALICLTQSSERLPLLILRQAIESGLTLGPPYLLASRSITTRKDLDRVLLHLCLGGFLAAAAGLFEAVRWWPIYQSYVGALHLWEAAAVTADLRGGFLRVHGPFLNYGSLGMFMAVMLVLMPYLRRYFRPILWLGIGLAPFLALVATHLRGGWISAAVGAALILLNRGRIASTLAIAATLGAGWMAKNFFLAGGTGDRSAEGSAQYRLDLLHHGLEQIWQHPLIGQGRETLLQAMSMMVQGQGIVDFVNTPLWVALSTGLIGLTLWLIAWSLPFLSAWRNARAAVKRGAAYPPALVPAVILGVIFVGLVFISPADRIMIWPMIAIGLVAPCLAIARGEASRQPAAAAPAARAARRPDDDAAPLCPPILLPR